MLEPGAIPTYPRLFAVFPPGDGSRGVRAATGTPGTAKQGVTPTSDGSECLRAGSHSTGCKHSQHCPSRIPAQTLPTPSWAQQSRRRLGTVTPLHTQVSPQQLGLPACLLLARKRLSCWKNEDGCGCGGKAAELQHPPGDASSISPPWLQSETSSTSHSASEPVPMALLPL